MDCFPPTAAQMPHWEIDHGVTPGPHRPIGARRVAESPQGGSTLAVTSAVVDAFARLRVTHMTMPHPSFRVCEQPKASGVAP